MKIPCGNSASPERAFLLLPKKIKKTKAKKIIVS